MRTMHRQGSDPAPRAGGSSGPVPPQGPPASPGTLGQPEPEGSHVVAIAVRRNNARGIFAKLLPGDPRPPKWNRRKRRWYDDHPRLPFPGAC